MALYGSEYSEAIPLLRIVAWKGLFVAMGISSGLLIITEGLQKWVVLRNLSGCLINVALNLLWIPKWGAMGSAWATLISFFMATFVVHAFIPAYRFVFKIQCWAILGGWRRILNYGFGQDPELIQSSSD